MRLKNIHVKYNVFKNLQKTSNPDKNLHKISIKTNKKTSNLFEMNIEKRKKLVKSTFENNRMKHEIEKTNENKNKQEKKKKYESEINGILRTLQGIEKKHVKWQ